MQFGGQTPLKLAAGLVRGRRAAARHERRRDRPRRGPRALRRRCSTSWATRRRRTRRRTRSEEALEAAGRVGFPLLVRPSYVLGGRAMEIVYSEDGLRDYLERNVPRRRRARSTSTASSRTRSRSTSTRCATARRSGSAGSCSTSRRPASTPATRACVLPPHSLGPRDARRRSASRRAGIALGLGVVGLLNVQFAVARRRALRDRGQPARLAHRAVRLQGDRRPAREDRLPAHARRAARRPRPAGRPDGRRRTSRSRRRCCRSTASTAPTRCSGPEMRSTGEVMGIARDFPTAFAKAQAAAGARAARQRARSSSR